MPDEVEFNRSIQLAGNFYNIRLKENMGHPDFLGKYIEADNIAQKNKTIFVFESKQTREAEAINQLQNRTKSLKLFKTSYLKRKMFDDYDLVRTFYYSFKRKVISEFKPNGIKISNFKFNNLNELALFL